MATVHPTTMHQPLVSAPARSSRRRWLGLLGAALGIAGLFALWRLTPLRDIVTADAVRLWAQTFGRQPWAPLAILLAYTPASLVMFPRPLITLAATVAFGPLLGAAYALAGIELAALSGYAGGRAMSRERLDRIGGRKLSELGVRLRSGGLAAMVLVRLLPVAPFVVVSLFAGQARVRLTAFVAGTALGMAPGLIGVTVLGSQLDRALGGGRPVDVYLVVGVLALLAAAALLARYAARQRSRSA